MYDMEMYMFKWKSKKYLDYYINGTRKNNNIT